MVNKWLTLNKRWLTSFKLKKIANLSWIFWFIRVFMVYMFVVVILF